MLAQGAVTREALRPFYGTRIAVTAIYRHTVALGGFPGRPPCFSALLVQVERADTGKLLTGHLWLPIDLSWTHTRLSTGDTILFEAEVVQYRKRSQRAAAAHVDTNFDMLDYGLAHPSAPRRLIPGPR